MRIELNDQRQIVLKYPPVRHDGLRDAGAAEWRVATLPMLDWPANLFSSAPAMADESAAYQ